MSGEKKLAILAGEGKIPAIVAEEALKRGVTTYYLPVVPDCANPPSGVAEIPFTPATKIFTLIQIVKDFGVDELVLVGKVPKRIVEHSRFRDFDFRTFWLKRRMLREKENNFFNILEREFRKAGITIVSQAKYLEHLLDFSGVLTKKKPNKTHWEDIEQGMALAREMARFNIGQTVVIKKGVVLSVESVEGTDNTISRVQDYTNGKGAVVCKVERPLQDLRFDVPTVGLETLRVMHQSGCDVLAIEEKKTFMVDYKEMIEYANQHGIVIVSTKVKPWQMNKQN